MTLRLFFMRHGETEWALSGFPGGNDYPAKQAGALSICVRDPEETKRVIEAILACVSDEPSTNTAEVSHA